MRTSLSSRMALLVISIQVILFVALFFIIENLFDDIIKRDIKVEQQSLQQLFSASLSPQLFSQDFSAAQYFLDTLKKNMPQLIYAEATDVFGHTAAKIGILNNELMNQGVNIKNESFYYTFNLTQGNEPVGKLDMIYSLKEYIAIKENFIKNLVFVLLSLTILSAIIVVYSTRKQTQGLRTLTTNISSISEGNYPDVSPINTNDEIHDLSVCFRDMVYSIKTRTDELEQKNITLKNAQKLTHIGNWEFNHTDSSLNWSDEVYRIFGYAPDSFTPNYDNFMNSIHYEDRDDVDQSFNTSIELKTPYNLVHRVVTPDGAIKYVREICKTTYDNKNKPQISYGTIQDITVEYEQEEYLKQTQKMDALGKLTGGVAHDFNNMLGIITGYIELLKGQLGDDNKLETYINNIEDASSRAVNLTSRLLSFTRKRPTQLNVVNINQIIEEGRSLLEKSLTAKIEVKYNENASLWDVKLDKSLLEDAVLNIAINAMHAINDVHESGTLIISTNNTTLNSTDFSQIKTPNSKYVSLSLKDNGIGMNSETKRKIFEPFYTTKGEHGTGLGMSQVYNFVEQSGGFIDVQSEIGGGTTISLYFPATFANTDEDSKPALSKNILRGNKELILIVDDEVPLVMLSKEILINNGYDVLTATNGEEALTIIKNSPIDLLLTDVIMPKMDGYKLAEEALLLYPSLKIQLMSGYSDTKKVTGKYKYLYDQRLIKPTPNDVLLERVYRVLH